MPSISTKQRYKAEPVLLKSKYANGASKLKQHSQVAEQMNGLDWNASMLGSLSWNSLHTHPTEYKDGIGRHRPSGREGWRSDSGHEQPAFPNAFNRQGRRQAANQPGACYSQAYGPTIRSATPAWLENVEQWSYSQTQQRYAHFPSQYQPYQQTVLFGTVTAQPWLTQQWQAVNNAPPPLPENSSVRKFDGSAPAFMPLNSPRSGVYKGLDGVSRTDRRSIKIHDQPTQNHQQRKSCGEDLSLPPSDSYGHGSVPWQQVVDIRGATIDARDDSTRTTIPAQALLAQQPWQNMLPAFDPSLRNNWSQSPTTQEKKLHVMERPEPSQKYVEQASQEPQRLDAGRSLLIVLDLNGTLLHRTARGSRNFITRPRVKEFLHYLFQHHHVLIWSSAMPYNVKRMSNKLLTGDQKQLMIACWGRDKLRIPSHAYHENVQVHKQLSWIWKDKTIQASNPNLAEVWGQENTVLIDDSFEKAASEPHNVILLDDFEGKEEQMESDVLGQVVKYLETLKWQRDVSAFMHREPFEFDANSDKFDWMPIVNAIYGFAFTQAG